MDASAYNMSFDKEQLALLCANYDRRIDSLGAENKRLKAENAKLREHIASFKELSQDMVIYAGQNMKRHFAKRLRKLGVPL